MSTSLARSTPSQPPQPAEHSVALTILQTVEHHQFASLPEASAYLRSLSPEVRFDLVMKQAGKFLNVKGGGDKYLEYLENFMEGDSAFRDRMEEKPSSGRRPPPVRAEPGRQSRRSSKEWGSA